MEVGCIMDHYEKQLYSLFKSYDFKNSGTLDYEALCALCNALQLEERGVELIKRLSGVNSDPIISFTEFRDALLSILGEEFSNKVYDDDLQKQIDSPSREVSPKYVYGSKKYGRRSRPQLHSPLDTQNDSEDTASNSVIQSECSKVQRSLSYSEVGVKKRKSAQKLKRCISFPGNRKHDIEKKYNKENVLSNWLNKCNSSRLVDFDEVRMICDSLDILIDNESILKSIFDEVVKDNSGKVAIDEFLYRVESEIDNDESAIKEPTISVDSISDKNKNNVHFEECSMDLVPVEDIIEIWELAGIQCAQQLLVDLGFHESSVNMSELLSVLHDEIKMIHCQSRKDSKLNLNTSLLQATLSLHQFEIKMLKTEMRQIIAERDKLRSDLTDANVRTQMIAQEVDENQMKMELSLRNCMKQGEQKHLDQVRELSNQFLNDKDVLSNTVAKHEQKIVELELEEQKQKSHISNLQNNNEQLEKEVCHYQEIITKLEETNVHLVRELQSFKSEKELWQSEDAKNRSSEISLLIEKLTEVQLENKMLKDGNDELTVEVECLQNKLSNSGRSLSFTKTTCAVDISGEEATSWSAECEQGQYSWGSQSETGGGYGVKRRNNSPNKDNAAFISEEESPRISKVRKCHKHEQHIDSQSVQHNEEEAIMSKDTSKCTSESGFECEGESGSDGSSGLEILNFEQILLKMKFNDLHPQHQYQTLIKFMTLLWKGLKNNVDLHSCSCEPCSVKVYIRNLCNQIIDNRYLDNYEDLINVSFPNNDNMTNECVKLKLEIKALKFKLDERSKQWITEKEKLNKQCNEFEVSIDQLRAEYEKCEDYWQCKVNEEREIFDQEQKISDEKFNDLLIKMSEYEEQFALQDKTSGPLSTIEERYSLERQFTDLEDEFECFKKITNEQIKSKNLEIELLRLKHLESAKISIITEDTSKDFIKMENTIEIGKKSAERDIFTNNLQVEVENVSDIDTKEIVSPIDYLWSQQSLQLKFPLTSESKSDTTRDYQNPAFKMKSKPTNGDFTPDLQNNETKGEWDRKKKVINPIKKPSSPIRCKSADAIKSQNKQKEFLNNYSVMGEFYGLNSLKEPTSLNCDQVMLHCSDLENHLRNSNGIQDYGFYNGSSTSMPEDFSTEHSRPSRIMMLEQRCLQLQMALRQQQAYSDTLIQQAWNSAQMECNVLRSRLAAADLLVQQLYVDNCRLVAALSAASPATQPTHPPSTSQ